MGVKARKVQVEDVGHFVMVDGPAISPDGGLVAFVVNRALLTEDRYISNIWLYNRKSGKSSQLTSGGADHNLAWAPDGTKIAFLSRNAEEGKTSISVVDLEGRGAPVPLFSTKGRIYQLDWAPDGEHILFLHRAEEKDIKEIDDIPFWFDGDGFVCQGITQLLRLNILNGEVETLTDAETDIRAFSCSYTGDKVALCLAHTQDFYLCDVLLMDVETRATREIALGFQTFVPPTWSPDNEYILIQGHRRERGMASHNNFWLIPVNGGHPKNLTAQLQWNIGNSLYCDIRMRLSQGPAWEGKYVYFLLSEGGSVKLASINVDTGEPKVIVDGAVGVNSFSVKGDCLVFSKGTDTAPIELWEKTEAGERRITHFNDDLVRGMDITRPERFTFEASDGEEIEGWIMKPADFDPNRRYPAIVWIHGGPKSKFGYAFMHEFQLYSAQGYVVIYMNPRGSDGYTEEFADIREHFGERDYQDIMEGLDWVKDRYPFIDARRVGVTGISYGGFMTNWVVTHTDRFAAAVSEEGISDQITMFGTTDIGPFFNKDVIGGEPWSDLKKYLEKSPLLKVDRVKTPIMFIHALDDFRCGVDQSIQFFTGLRCLEQTTKLLLLPAGGHIVGWTGKPSFRIERLRQKLLWFDKFLVK
jgi:acylaminoacyl-peptidase